MDGTNLTPYDGTRLIDTLDGPQPYAELVPVLALGVERVMKRLAQQPPESLTFSFGFILDLHREAFGEVVEWAWRPRTKNVQIRAHEPPPPHQAPVMLRQYADDLEYRVSRVNPETLVLEDLAPLFAFCEGRFVHIHPFQDFNGRVSRLLTWTMILRLRLPPKTSLVPPDGDLAARQRLWDALSAYDNGDSRHLEALWLDRLQEGLFTQLGLVQP